MQFQLPISIPAFEPKLQHHDSVVLMGSCFTEHMTGFLHKAGFTVHQNAHGILFNPLSIVKALNDVVLKRNYTSSDLFFHNEYWHSWFHHSDFSFRNPTETLHAINTAIETHHQALLDAKLMIITLGSAFAYQHIEGGFYVSNNHRAPHDWFRKDLLSVQTIQSALQEALNQVHQLNPSLRVVFTISPVRHVRDGVIENNRSKARLIEAVHSLPNTYYFPAYELVIDVLRDYRFFDYDLVHPNYAATRFVWEHFSNACIDAKAKPIMEQMEQLYKARHHAPKDSGSLAHQRFMAQQAELCQQLQTQYPYLDLQEFLAFFNQTDPK